MALLTDKKYIAFWGYPDPIVMQNVKADYPEAEWLDLDVEFDAPDFNILPDISCKIIKNLVNNALHYKKNIVKVIAAIGK